ncbi:GAF domain-containing protein, partial [bacterium]
RERRILGMLPDTCGDEGDLRLVASGQTVVSRSLRQAPDACLRRLAGYGIGSLMVAPVRVADDCLGALGVWAREDQAFSEVDRALLASMAGVMALALRCASLGHTGGCSLALPMAKSH